MFHLILHITGGDNGSGSVYLEWSGFISDLGLIGGVLMLWHRLNCHAAGCWRIGIHHVKGTHFITCRHHHPELKGKKPTWQHIHLAHHKAKKGK